MRYWIVGIYIEYKEGGDLGARSKIKYFRFVMIARSVNGKACGQSKSNKLDNKELKVYKLNVYHKIKIKKKLKTKARTQDLLR